METFSVWLAFCEGNSPMTGEFPSQRPVTRSFDVFFDLRLNKRLSKPGRLHRAHHDATVMLPLKHNMITDESDQIKWNVYHRYSQQIFIHFLFHSYIFGS